MSMGLDITQATIAQIGQGLESAAFSSTRLVEAYLARIAAYDLAGPCINSLLCLNPKAGEEARARDAERARGHARGPLHGIPVVVKDNIDVAGLATTAGSQLLAGHVPGADAEVVARLRRAGAIVLAKANMQEFAGGGGSVMSSRDPDVLKAGTPPSGYSSQGGQTRNPHSLAHSPSSSSGGTGASVAAAFAGFGLGTDTVMSIRAPSSVNGIFGLKPTHGLVSCEGVVPLAPSLDVVGPMGRSLADVALAMEIMAAAGGGYEKSLRPGALRGARLGLVKSLLGVNHEVDQAIAGAVSQMAAQGAIVVEVDYPAYLLDAKEGLCWLIMVSEFKAHIARYLSSAGAEIPRSMQELIEAAARMGSDYRSPEKHFALRYAADQALPLDHACYLAARHQGMALVRQTVDALLREHELDALVYPTLSGEAPRITAGGQQAPKPYPSLPPSHHATVIANLAGYPDLSMPVGMTAAGLPVGMSLLGRAHSEASLLAYAYDLDAGCRARRLPRFTPSLETDRV